MKRLQRSTLALLLSILLANVLFRYPQTAHEIGVDSFVLHGLATSLAREGYARWALTPLSYLGLYPLSEPSGSVFLVSEISLGGNLGIEASILILDWIISILGALGGFLLAREFSKAPAFCLLTSFVFSISPEFVSSLSWQVPTRIAFTSLIPFLIWAIIRFARSGSPQSILILAGVLMLMMSFHRLAALMGLVILASILTLILLTAIKALRIRIPSIFMRPGLVHRSSWLALVLFLAIIGFMVTSAGVLDQYSVGVVATGASPVVQLANLMVSLARSAGLLLPFAAIGIVVLTRRKAKRFAEPFIVLVFLCLVPTLFLRQYSGFYTVPVASLFIAIGLDWLVNRPRTRRARFAIVSVAVAVTLLGTQAIVSYNIPATSAMDQTQYNLGLYSLTLHQGTLVFADGLEGARVAAVSGCPYLPVGGATTAFQSAELLTHGFLDPNGLSISPLPLSSITIESDSPFVLNGVQAEADWATLLSSTASSIPASLVVQYDPGYVVSTVAFPNNFFAYGHYYPSPLIVSAQATRYSIYADGQVIVWELR